jgi:hypothetical protein
VGDEAYVVNSGQTAEKARATAGIGPDLDGRSQSFCCRRRGRKVNSPAVDRATASAANARLSAFVH